MRTTIAVLACAAALAVPALAVVPTNQTVRQFMAANCQKMTDACTKPIAQSVLAAGITGQVSPDCFKMAPDGQALDIALWLGGHHDLDDKPMSDAAVITAKQLWAYCRPK
jgi:hypothetical protein